MLPKPKDYSYYQSSKNGIPFRDWPQECKDYKNYLRVIRIHPEWAECTLEELAIKQRESKAKRAAIGRSVFRDKWNQMPQEEKAAINKKKGSFYHKMSPEEKLEHNKVLQQRSQNFWNGMDKEARVQFSQYRESKLTDEQKQQRIERGIQHLADYQKTLTPEDIQQQVKRLNIARKKKLEENPAYREEQIKLLRLHNQEYFDNMTGELRDKLLHHNSLNRRFEENFERSEISKDFYYKAEYMVKLSDDLIKYWDYAIYSKYTDELIAVIDLDGDFFHAIGADYNKTQSNEERDERRGKFIPDRTKCFFIEELSFEEGFKELEEKLPGSYDAFIIDLYQQYLNMGFPYPYYPSSQLIKSYQQLLRLNPVTKYDYTKARNREGDRLIYHFHKSIWSACVKGCIPPVDLWADKELLLEAVENHTLIRSPIARNKIVQGFNISANAQRVNVFSAGRAKIIVSKFLDEFNSVFDPFSGTSSVLLGTISMGKDYIGQDISRRKLAESRKLVDYLRLAQANYVQLPHIQLKYADPAKDHGKYECLFTYLPRYNKELWPDLPKADFTADQLIDICLNNYQCQRYLFIVDETVKYQDYVVETFEKSSFLGIEYEYLVLIDR